MAGRTSSSPPSRAAIVCSTTCRRRRCSRFVDITEQAVSPRRLVEHGSRGGPRPRRSPRRLHCPHGRLREDDAQTNYEASNGLADQLLHNNGDGTFTDVARRAGVGDTGWGLAGAWADYDEDGYPDLYVANEYGFSVLYHNRGDGTFEDVSEKSGARIRTAGMSVAW
jgi:hypothetical protein